MLRTSTASEVHALSRLIVHYKHAGYWSDKIVYVLNSVYTQKSVTCN